MRGGIQDPLLALNPTATAHRASPPSAQTSMSEIAQESASSRSRTPSRTSSSRLITPYPKTGSDDSADRTPPSTNRLALAHQVPRPLPSPHAGMASFLSHHPQDSRRYSVSLRMARWPGFCCPIRMSVIFYFHLTTHAYLPSSDIAVSISSIFPIVYGILYRFNPLKLGSLYLLMLAGSVLAECGTGRVGDKLVSSDFSCPLGLLTIIEKRNAEYAAGKGTMFAVIAPACLRRGLFSHCLDPFFAS